MLFCNDCQYVLPRPMRAFDIQLTVIEIPCPTNQFASTVDLKVFACRDISYSEDPRVRLKVCETTGGTQHGCAWHGGSRRDINQLEGFTSSPRAHPLWSWFPFSRKKLHHSHTALFVWIRQEKCKNPTDLTLGELVREHLIIKFMYESQGLTRLRGQGSQYTLGTTLNTGNTHWYF